MGTKPKTLSDLLLHQMRDLHFAERHGAKMFGKLAKAASAENVRGMLEGLAEKAHAQVDQIEAILDQIDKKAHAVPCEAMQGLVEEAKELLRDFEQSEALDAGLIGTAQAMLHYAVARCSSVRVWATRLGMADAGVTFTAMLADKRRLLDMLDRLAEQTVPSANEPEIASPRLTLKTAALAGLA